jgi:hypothetical protein
MDPHLRVGLCSYCLVDWMIFLSLFGFTIKPGSTLFDGKKQVEQHAWTCEFSKAVSDQAFGSNGYEEGHKLQRGFWSRVACFVVLTYVDR